MRTSVAVRNANLQQDGDRLNDGFLRLYDGTIPLDPDTALGANTLLVEFALGNPAMGVVSGGSRPFSPFASANGLANGTPTFGRFFQSDGTTAEEDMTVGTELILADPVVVLGNPVAVPTISWTQAVGT